MPSHDPAALPAPLTVESFRAFVAKLRAHDWLYEYSDDGHVWRRGQAERDQLSDIANTHPTLEAAMKAFSDCRLGTAGTYSERTLVCETELRNLLQQVRETSATEHAFLN